MRIWKTIGIGLLLAGCATTPREKKGQLRWEGVWATLGNEQDQFNIEVYKDGTALTNFSKGPSGAKGERGTWTTKDDSIILKYDSGWTDWITAKRERMKFEKRGYKPGDTLDALPTNIVPAFPLSGRGAEFIGVWKLGDKEDYLALVSDGSAAMTREGGPTKKGTWRVTKTGLVAEWPEEKTTFTLNRKGSGKYQGNFTAEGKQEPVTARRQTGRDK